MAPRRGVFSQARTQPLRWVPWALMAVALCGWAFWLFRAPGMLGGSSSGSGLRLVDSSQPSARGRTLVVYVFSGSDPEYANNLRFFISEAVKVGRGGGRQAVVLSCASGGAGCSRVVRAHCWLNSPACFLACWVF